jgi:glycosyltransferase involved in cell wall biosynthesis
MKESLIQSNKEIVIFCPSIEEGGVEKNLFTIGNYLSKNNIKVNIITANKNKKKFFNKNIIFCAPKTNFWNNKHRIFKAIVCAFFLIKNYYDKDCKILSFQSNLISILLANILNKQVIVRSNTSPKSYINNFIKKTVFSVLFKKADKIIVNSKVFKKDIDKLLNINSTLIYNPSINLRLINTQAKKKLNINFFNTKKKIIKIINVARLTKQKDHITLLKSLLFSKKKEFIRLVIIGKGPEEGKLKKFIKDNNLKKNVKMLGYKSNPFPYIKNSDIFILTSKFEGLPNVLLEAIALKKIVISTNCPTGPKEILLNGKGGYLFKTGKYISLANLIDNITNNISPALKKMNIAYKNLHRFEVNRNCRKYCNLINKLLIKNEFI